MVFPGYWLGRAGSPISLIPTDNLSKPAPTPQTYQLYPGGMLFGGLGLEAGGTGFGGTDAGGTEFG